MTLPAKSPSLCSSDEYAASSEAIKIEQEKPDQEEIKKGVEEEVEEEIKEKMEGQNELADLRYSMLSHTNFEFFIHVLVIRLLILGLRTWEG